MSKAKRSNPERIVACPVCDEAMPLSTRSAHLATAHPGYRISRRGFVLVVTDPEGSERAWSAPEMGERNRRAAERMAGPKPKPEPRSEPEPAPTIDETRRPFAWQATASPPVVSRQAIADAFSERMLADMIRQTSVTLSEWDGAGEAGHLSAIESAQLASLFYDATLGGIERYFRGSVDRFRLTVGLAILMLGKGRIHLAAIAQRRRERAIVDEANAYADELAHAAGPDYDPVASWAPVDEPPPPAPPSPQPLTGVELIAARQAAARARG